MYGYIDTVTKDVQRNVDEVWDDWFSEMSAIAEDVEVTINTPRTTKVQSTCADNQGE